MPFIYPSLAGSMTVFSPPSSNIELWPVHPVPSTLEFRLNLNKASEVLIPTTSSGSTRFYTTSIIAHYHTSNMAAVFSDHTFGAPHTASFNHLSLYCLRRNDKRTAL